VRRPWCCRLCVLLECVVHSGCAVLWCFWVSLVDDCQDQDCFSLCCFSSRHTVLWADCNVPWLLQQGELECCTRSGCPLSRAGCGQLKGAKKTKSPRGGGGAAGGRAAAGIAELRCCRYLPPEPIGATSHSLTHQSFNPINAATALQNSPREDQTALVPPTSTLQGCWRSCNSSEWFTVATS